MLSFFWTVGGLMSKQKRIVLMYHHVTDDPNIRIPMCICSVEKFRHDILKLKAEGYQFVSASEILHSGKIGERVALVTFDDVPHNALENAVPFLREQRIPFVLFIATQYMNTPGYITSDEVKELANDRYCTIGAHTITHPVLRKSSKKWDEIAGSKKELESLIGKEVKYLAYPYGKHSSISYGVRRIAHKAGFEAAFGTVPSTINRISSLYRFYLPRIVI